MIAQLAHSTSPRWRRLRLPYARQRGQSTVETVLCLMFLCLIFFSLIQIVYLYAGQLINHHAAFVAGRSHVVGFNQAIVKRAQEVGSIGMSGALVEPEALADLPIRELGLIEPTLIEEFVADDGYLMHYEYWPRISLQLPLFNSELIQDYTVQVRDYPVTMPMKGAYLNSNSVDFSSTVSMYNHAGHYLE